MHFDEGLNGGMHQPLRLLVEFRLPVALVLTIQLPERRKHQVRCLDSVP